MNDYNEKDKWDPNQRTPIWRRVHRRRALRHGAVPPPDGAEAKARALSLDELLAEWWAAEPLVVIVAGASVLGLCAGLGFVLYAGIEPIRAIFNSLFF